VQRVRNRGVFVRVLDRDDLTEIYQLRLALEVEAVRTLAGRRHVPPEAARAVGLLSTLDAQSSQRDFVEADLAFHSAIVDGAGNRRLARAHESLRAEIRLLLAQLVNRYASVRQLAKEHRDLLAAIEAGDPDEAEAAIRGHLGRATVWLAEHAVTRPRPRARST
jgi:DNA-binding GntR family transcriptional regulator